MLFSKLPHHFHAAHIRQFFINNKYGIVFPLRFIKSLNTRRSPLCRHAYLLKHSRHVVADGRRAAMNIKDEEIFCDKLRLNQVLLNLLSNSVKYTNEGGKVVVSATEIKVNSEVSRTHYLFKVLLDLYAVIYMRKRKIRKSNNSIHRRA